MNESPEQEATRTKRVPHVDNVEKHYCQDCDGAISPAAVRNEPFIKNDAGNPIYGRLLAIPCEHCNVTYIYRLLFTAERWRLDGTRAAKLNGTDDRFIYTTLQRMRRGA